MEIAMKVETSTVTKLHITGAVSLAPNTVFLEDLKPKRGKITVSRWGGGKLDRVMGRDVGRHDSRPVLRRLDTGYFDS